MRMIVWSFLLSLSLLSCIRSEAPNAEADILSCTLPAELLKAEPQVENESVTLLVTNEADVTRLAPLFTLTPGATITPASGTVLDFSLPQRYTVRSEDGAWSKTYTVRCMVSGISTNYPYETISLEPNYGRYHIFYDPSPGGEPVNWGSGNAGYAFTGVAGQATDYPTSQSPAGYRGQCAKLVTRSTGPIGALVGMYIAAGNLFIGTFDAASAMTSPLKATRFGKPFEYKPTYLSGYYKYTPGKEYTSKGQPVPGEVDDFDVYAVFFETDEQVRYLDGSNALTSPNLVSVARLTKREVSDEWIPFNVPFVARPGKVIDEEKLKRGGYQLAVIYSSSIRGAYFEGAVGSTLHVDEVEVIYSDK